ncbi:DUF1778 domain-containing protein [Rufibacter sp. XAAS-G3-1]|uniref:type II toxin-antitoxin system TacA family antitoxin n=1 Tax=Rufibacter sp. XAAS-G3-1 TaxID=2729134 RepID=UPI0015E77C08|nr:DUF1778 domain-containing protein [Rufibacter sp. XAAS-G3-1]
MATAKQEKARFDTRLPIEQKQFFEKAAQLGGFRNLTDFVLAAAQTRAKEIIEEKEKIIASQKDSEVFFNAITNPGKPNEALLSAAKDFKALFAK